MNFLVLYPVGEKHKKGEHTFVCKNEYFYINITNIYTHYIYRYILIYNRYIQIAIDIDI